MADDADYGSTHVRAIRQRTFFVLLALVCLFLPVLAFSTPDPGLRVLYAVAEVWFLGLLIATVEGSLRQRQLEYLLFIGGFAVLMGLFVVDLRAVEELDALTIQNLSWRGSRAVTLLTIGAFIVFGHRRGLQLSMASLGAMFVAPVIALSGLVSPTQILNTYDVRVALFYAIGTIALAWGLSRSNQVLGAERTDASATARLAFVDALTGLANRRELDAAMAAMVESPWRATGPGALLMVDVDHFKHFNDAFGHDAGDVVLRDIAEQLAACVRDHDAVGRWGGEEFALVLPGIGEEAALDVARRCRQRVQRMPAPRDITISIGVALRGEGESARHLFLRADRALYGAKEAGRNRVVIDRDGTTDFTQHVSVA